MKDFNFGNFKFSLVKREGDIFNFVCPQEDIIKDFSSEGSLVGIIYNNSILLKNHIIKKTKNNFLYFVSSIKEDASPLLVSIKKKKFNEEIILKLLRRQRFLLNSYGSIIKDNNLFCEVGNDRNSLFAPDPESNIFRDNLTIGTRYRSSFLESPTYPVEEVALPAVNRAPRRRVRNEENEETPSRRTYPRVRYDGVNTPLESTLGNTTMLTGMVMVNPNSAPAPSLDIGIGAEAFRRLSEEFQRNQEEFAQSTASIGLTFNNITRSLGSIDTETIRPVDMNAPLFPASFLRENESEERVS